METHLCPWESQPCPVRSPKRTLQNHLGTGFISVVFVFCSDTSLTGAGGSARGLARCLRFGSTLPVNEWQRSEAGAQLCQGPSPAFLSPRRGGSRGSASTAGGVENRQPYCLPRRLFSVTIWTPLWPSPSSCCFSPHVPFPLSRSSSGRSSPSRLRTGLHGEMPWHYSCRITRQLMVILVLLPLGSLLFYSCIIIPM